MSDNIDEDNEQLPTDECYEVTVSGDQANPHETTHGTDTH
jgi:hypothetical protein